MITNFAQETCKEKKSEVEERQHNQCIMQNNQMQAQQSKAMQVLL